MNQKEIEAVLWNYWGVGVGNPFKTTLDQNDIPNIATLLTIAEARQPQPVTLYDLTAYEARQASVKAQPVTAQLLDYDSLRAVYQSAHDEELPKWSRGWAKSAAENAGMTAVAKAQDVETWTFAQQRIRGLEATLDRAARNVHNYHSLANHAFGTKFEDCEEASCVSYRQVLQPTEPATGLSDQPDAE